MLDPKLLRQHIEDTAAQLARRGVVLDVALITELEAKRKTVEMTTQELQHLRNSRSKLIGQAKSRGEDVEPLLAEVSDLGEKLNASEENLKNLQARLDSIYHAIPNIPHASVPEGKSEADNLEIRRWGDIPSFDFTPKDHVAIGKVWLRWILRVRVKCPELVLWSCRISWRAYIGLWDNLCWICTPASMVMQKCMCLILLSNRVFLVPANSLNFGMIFSILRAIQVFL